MGKQLCAMVLALALGLACTFPTYAEDTTPSTEHTSLPIVDSGEEIPTNEIPTNAPQEPEQPEVDGGAAELSPPEENITQEILVLSDTQSPAFTAKIESTFEGYVLRGTFTDFLPNTSCVRPMYSLDGETYEPIGGPLEPMDWDLSELETSDPEELIFLQNQICAYATDEPMNSYLKKGLERFYIKLQIITETGESYDTQAAVIQQGTPQAPPENTVVSANFTTSMIAVDRTQRPPFTYGKYQITVKENATPKDVYALLPDTLPIEVRIVQPNTDEVITSGIVECEVTWKELPKLDLTAGETFTIRDAAKELVVPAGTVISTPLGTYVLSAAVAIDSPYARDEVRIVMNAIDAKEKPDISLTGNMNDDAVNGFEPLSLAFRLKPSGATSVKAYSYVEGNKDWTEICEILPSRNIDANQSAELYGYVDILQPGESPYADYLKGKTTGCLIGIIIEGGTFDGERVILPWPGEYTPPTRIPELDGAGGNQNNAGSGGEDGTDEGQRPNLPEKPEDTPVPPLITLPPPTEDNQQVPEERKSPRPKKTIVPKQHKTDSSNMENPTDGAESIAASQPLPSQSPQLGEDTPVVSIQRRPMAERTPQAQTQSSRTDDAVSSTTATDENEIDTGQRFDNKSDSESNNSSFPMAAIALVGGGIAVSVGVAASSGAVTGSGFWSKFLQALRKAFSKR